MLVEMHSSDLAIITAHYNNLITAQYDEIERIEAMPADDADTIFGALIESRADQLAAAHNAMAFFHAELEKFSDLVSRAKKAEGAGGIWA
jgi:hypothetical protein